MKKDNVVLDAGTENEPVKVDLTTGKVEDIKEYRENNEEALKAVITEKDFSKMNKQEISENLQLQEDRIKALVETLTPGTDWGYIPGTNSKSLLRGGSDKLAFLAGLRTEYEIVTETLRPEMNLLGYRIKAKLFHQKTGKFVGEAIASVNSLERGFMRQIMEQPKIKVETKDKKGATVMKEVTDTSAPFQLKVGMTVFSIENTLIQMGQIRSKKKAVRDNLGIASMFTQDMPTSPVSENRGLVYATAEDLARDEMFKLAYKEINNGKAGNIKDRQKYIIKEARKIANVSRTYKEWYEEDVTAIVKAIEEVQNGALSK